MTGRKKIIRYIALMALITLLILSVGATSLHADSKSQVTSFVTRFYQICLERTPDEEGLNQWVSRLLSRKITGAKFAEGIIFSAEFASKGTDNEEFITIIFWLII